MQGKKRHVPVERRAESGEASPGGRRPGEAAIGRRVIRSSDRWRQFRRARPGRWCAGLPLADSDEEMERDGFRGCGDNRGSEGGGRRSGRRSARRRSGRGSQRRNSHRGDRREGQLVLMWLLSGVCGWYEAFWRAWCVSEANLFKMQDFRANLMAEG